MKIKIKTALVSVSNKAGLEELVSCLTKHNVDIISTGGTSKFIKDLGIEVTDVSSLTNFPEMMDGRVKTLHPNIHGGLLAKRDDENHKIDQQEQQLLLEGEFLHHEFFEGSLDRYDFLGVHRQSKQYHRERLLGFVVAACL